MGYRLYVQCKDKPEISYYGTKLYGYVKDETKLLSYEYLRRIGKLQEMVDNQNPFAKVEDLEWDYCYYNHFDLTHDQFSDFITLYAQDLCDKYDAVYAFNFLKTITPFVSEPGYKYIEWG